MVSPLTPQIPSLHREISRASFHIQLHLRLEAGLEKFFYFVTAHFISLHDIRNFRPDLSYMTFEPAFVH